MSKPQMHRLDPHQVECAKLLCANAERHSLHRVFSDFREMSAIAISNAVDRFQFEAREARYLQIAGGYQKDELQRFAKMLGCVTLSFDGQRSDFLGRLFMSLELGNHFAGQFFTLFEVSSLMARMSLHDVSPESVAERGGVITLCEPACGAGGMWIAFADVMTERGVNYQACAHVAVKSSGLFTRPQTPASARSIGYAGRQRCPPEPQARAPLQATRTFATPYAEASAREGIYSSPASR